MSRRLLAVLALLAAAFAILTGLAVHKGILGAPPQQTAVIGGPFHLMDQSGRPVDQRVLNGKWSAVFFGYTYCPDACPTTLFALGQAQKLLGAKARSFQTVFISVDPGRDTPAQLRTYLSNPAFPGGTIGLTGSQAQIVAAASSYKTFYQKVGTGADYTVNHMTLTYLMNPKGRLACVIDYDVAPPQLAQKIEAAMARGPDAQRC